MKEAVHSLRVRTASPALAANGIDELEERWPRFAVIGDSADAVVRRRHVEHHDVRIVFSHNAFEVLCLNRLDPIGEHVADGLFVTM